MWRNSRSRRTSLLIGLFACLAALHAEAMPKNLPDAVIRAHTIFLENET